MELTKTNAVLSRLKGYKHTEIGPIPSDWDVKCLGDLGQFLKGKGIKKDEVVPDGMPCVRYGELYTVYSNKIERTVSFINESTSKESIQLRYGDLLFAGSGETKEEIGKSAVILRNDTYAGGDIVIFRTKDIDYHFLGYLSNFTPIQKQKSLNGQGDAVVHIYSGGLSKVKIPLPPTLTEQKAIATALSDVDALISSLEKLIAKKKAIKQGAMQLLLTPPHRGGKRLPGFKGDWTYEPIIDFASITTGACDTQDRIKDGIYPFFVRSQKVEKINKFSFDGEAILTSGDGVGVGKIFHYINGKFDFHQRVYCIHGFRKNVDGKYFFNQFSNHFFDRVMSMTAKSSVDSVRREMIADMKIYLPPTKKEQTTIALILSDMDLKIKSLENKKVKYQEIKQGMMQELLTGKTRLV